MSLSMKFLLLLAALTPMTTIVPVLAAAPPSGAISRETHELQNAADRAYGDGEYSTAIALYRDELAAKGDKYAQYMVGLMLQNGQGVARDPVAAAAWLSIAADRGDEQLVAARDEAVASLDATQTAALSEQVATLANTHGDCAVVTSRVAQVKVQRSEMIANNQRGDVVVIDDKAYVIDISSLRRDIYELERYLEKHCAN